MKAGKIWKTYGSLPSDQALSPPLKFQETSLHDEYIRLSEVEAGDKKELIFQTSMRQFNLGDFHSAFVSSGQSLWRRTDKGSTKTKGLGFRVPLQNLTLIFHFFVHSASNSGKNYTVGQQSGHSPLSGQDRELDRPGALRHSGLWLTSRYAGKDRTTSSGRATAAISQTGSFLSTGHQRRLEDQKLELRISTPR